MKNLALILFFLPLVSFGQQNLWSTAKISNTEEAEINIISKEEVTRKMLDLFDIYDNYYDATGFTIETFNRMFEKYNINKSILESVETNEPTAIAYKDNHGYGSFVAVLFLNKKNIDAIIFANHISTGSIRTSDKEKFSKLINSFWNYGTTESTHYNEKTDPNTLYTGKKAFGNTILSLENRRFTTPPRIEDNGDLAGRVAVEITVNRSGTVISARSGVRGTTLNDPALWEKCEKAAIGAKLNQLENAPATQRGIITFVFKAK